MKRSLKHILATSTLLFAGLSTPQSFAASDDIIVVNKSTKPQHVVVAYTGNNHSTILPDPKAGVALLEVLM